MGNRKQNRNLHGPLRVFRRRRSPAFDRVPAKSLFGRARPPNEIAAPVHPPNPTTPAARSKLRAHAWPARTTRVARRGLSSAVFGIFLPALPSNAALVD